MGGRDNSSTAPFALHPAIFDRPLSHEDAARNIEALLAAPACRVLAEEEGFWDVYRDVTKDVSTRGNLGPDAHLAALLSPHGVVTLCTHDRDFRKFSFLEVRDPLAWRSRRALRVRGRSG